MCLKYNEAKDISYRHRSDLARLILIYNTNIVYEVHLIYGSCKTIPVTGFAVTQRQAGSQELPKNQTHGDSLYCLSQPPQSTIASWPRLASWPALACPSITKHALTSSKVMFMGKDQHCQCWACAQKPYTLLPRQPNTS